MTFYTQYNVDNDWDRQWNWFLCNEPFDYWQEYVDLLECLLEARADNNFSGAPRGTPTLVSRLVTDEYWQRQCTLQFPEVNGYTYGSVNPDINVHSVNKHTKGWRLDDTTRLIWTNG